MVEARKILGMSLGMCPKDRTYKAYIEVTCPASAVVFIARCILCVTSMDQYPPYCLCDNHQLRSFDCSSCAISRFGSTLAAAFCSSQTIAVCLASAAAQLLCSTCSCMVLCLQTTVAGPWLGVLAIWGTDPRLLRPLRSLKPLHADLEPHMTLVAPHYIGSTCWMHSLGRNARARNTSQHRPLFPDSG